MYPPESLQGIQVVNILTFPSLNSYHVSQSPPLESRPRAACASTTDLIAFSVDLFNLEWLRVSFVCVNKKWEILFPGWWISQENELTHILNRMADMEYDDSTFYSSRPLEERWPPLGAAVDNIAENGAKNSEHQRKWVLFSAHNIPRMFLNLFFPFAWNSAAKYCNVRCTVDCV